MLDNVLLINGLVVDDALETEAAQIDTKKFAFQNELHNGSTYGRALLDTVAAESGGKQHVAVVRMVSDDTVLVESVVVVETGPRALQLQHKRQLD